MTKLTVIIIAAAGAVLASASFIEAFGEITPYLVGGVSEEQRFAAVVSGDFKPADSRWSKELFLNDCLDVPRSVFGLVQQPAYRQSLLKTCRTEAHAIAASMPTMSSAWLVVAASSAGLGDFPRMRSALALSKAAGPKLQWLADRRSELAERFPAEMDAVTDAGYADDVAVLAQGRQGLDLLAQRYVRNPEKRDFYAGIVETVGAEQQRQFLDRVKFHMAALQ